MRYIKSELDSKISVFPIGSFARLLNVHQRTLRIYDKEKILSPKRTAKNRRVYSVDDLERAKLILFLTRNLALNLSGVKFVLALIDKNKVKPSRQLAFVEEIASLANITAEEQELNIQKTSGRGRKAKVKE